ncbi:MAG: ABC transporter permease [Bdellovibrionales bacterium]|nr:ABC transporter permease [Bdellovibrionales bacterium]
MWTSAGWWGAERAIAGVSLRESFRDRLFYNSLLVALFLLALTYLLSNLSATGYQRVLVSFSLGANQFCLVAVGTLMGASVIQKELQRRTFLLLLSRPLTHTGLVLGKFMGLAAVLLLNGLLLGIIQTAVILAAGGELGAQLFAAQGLLVLQAVCLAAIALFFGSFSTPALASLYTLGLYIVGSASGQLEFLAERAKSEGVAWVLRAAYWAVPAFERFQITDVAVYSLELHWPQLVWAAVQAAVLVVLCLVGAGRVLESREL